MGRILVCIIHVIFLTVENLKRIFYFILYVEDWVNYVFSSYYLPSSSMTKSDQSLCFGQQHGGSSGSDTVACNLQHRITVQGCISPRFCHAVSKNSINSKFCI